MVGHQSGGCLPEAGGYADLSLSVTESENSRHGRKPSNHQFMEFRFPTTIFLAKSTMVFFSSFQEYSQRQGSHELTKHPLS